VTDGDEAIGEGAVGVGVLKQMLEVGDDSAPPDSNVPTDVSKPRARFVGEAACLIQSAAQAIAEIAYDRNRVAERTESGCDGTDGASVPLHAGGGFQHWNQSYQLGAVQDASRRMGSGKDGTDI
jgi:hypothetical protein